VKVAVAKINNIIAQPFSNQQNKRSESQSDGNKESKVDLKKQTQNSRLPE
jgi:hypothetical protein